MYKFVHNTWIKTAQIVENCFWASFARFFQNYSTINMHRKIVHFKAVRWRFYTIYT